MNARNRIRSHAGFTLIELTALIAIVAVLTGSLLPVAQNLDTSANRLQRSPKHAEVAGKILALQAEARGGAQTFFLDLGAAAADPGAAPAPARSTPSRPSATPTSSSRTCARRSSAGYPWRASGRRSASA